MRSRAIFPSLPRQDQLSEPGGYPVCTNCGVVNTGGRYLRTTREWVDSTAERLADRPPPQPSAKRKRRARTASASAN